MLSRDRRNDHLDALPTPRSLWGPPTRTGKRVARAPVRACRHGGWIVAACAFAACHSSSTGPSPVVQTNTITITSTGVSPKNIQVAVGSRVLFVNHDSRSHSMNSDPHPEHTDCPEINQVGFLAPGQSRETGNLVDVRTCGFHDHDDPGSTAFQGSIVINPDPG
jgi:plastocyanin